MFVSDHAERIPVGAAHRGSASVLWTGRAWP